MSFEVLDNFLSLGQWDSVLVQVHYGYTVFSEK